MENDITENTGDLNLGSLPIEEQHNPQAEAHIQAEKIAPPVPPTFSPVAKAWLNALPSHADTTDLFTINEDNFAVKCIRGFFENKPFELNLQANYPASDWLNHFYFESKNRERVFGNKNFGVGYPLVFANIGGYELASPLFFWQLAIEPHAQNTDHWIIQKTESQAIVPNYPLFFLIDRMFGSELTNTAKQYASNPFMGANALAEITDAVRIVAGLQEQGLTNSVLPCPGPSEINYLTQQGTIHWTGVIGIFPSVPMTILASEPVIAPNLAGGLEWEHAFTTMPLDPSQRAALNAAQHHALTVVEGASGTGKTYTISNIVINALSNGKKCLVVSKNINALRRAQKFLLEKGFGDLSFIVRDVKGDQLMLSDMLRAAAESKPKAQFDADLFRTVLNRCSRETGKLDSAWESLHAPVFGNMTFVDTVGRFLRANRAEGKELLSSQLGPTDFQFTSTEFDSIVAAIRASEPLFRKFPSLSHPLASLKSPIFIENDGENGLAFAKNKVRALLDRATALHHRLIARTNDYAESLTDHYERHYAELVVLTKRVRNQLEDGIFRFGADFDKSASATEKLYGVFSEKYKEMLAQKEQIGQSFDALHKHYALRKYFDFDFPAHFDNKNIKKINEISKDFEAALLSWRKRIPAITREDIRRLNTKSILYDLDYKDQIKDLEHAMDAFLEEFNNAGLFEESFKHEALTIPKRQEFLESIITRLEDTQFYLRDFPDFYVWQKHWLSLSPQSQKVVQALGKVKPRNWVAAFESWYLHHILQNAYSPSLVWDNETLDNWSKANAELRRLMPFQISAAWHERKTKALKALKNENADGYKTWFGKNNRTLSATRNPEELYIKHINALTETLPCLLVTPEVAQNVVQNANMLFDLVLVDEAHNVIKQKGYHLFDMAKNLIVFGDSKQDMTPFEHDDLLEFCKTLGAKTITLEYQHQDCPEEWIEFNKIAFETPFKRLPSGLEAKDVTVVENVGGRYNEETQTNEAEARQIIDWLNLIEPTQAKTYPIVGIACATVQQRDLIAAQLLKIRQRKTAGYEKIQQLHLNGLGIYQFGELQGQHVDVLLLSLTHGLTDVAGHLTEHLHFWNTQLGINQLHVALTRATKKIFIAHSIPSGIHTILAADKHHRGTCIVSQLVKFASSIQEGDRDAANAQLEEMKQQLEYPKAYFPSNIFMEEVEIALQPYFEPGRIVRNGSVAGVTVPVLVESAGEGSLPNILLFDGVVAKSDMPSYEWEEKLKHHFAKNHVGTVATHAVQWWKSPKQEARKLAGRIISRENQEGNV